MIQVTVFLQAGFKMAERKTTPRDSLVSWLPRAAAIAVGVVALLFSGALAQASVGPPPDLSPEVFQIAKTLRCPVCQGESAAESNSGVATEMRRIIAEQLAQGKTAGEIRQFFVARYGDWILYEPPKRGLTLWVWFSPLVGLGVLALVLWRYLAAARSRSVGADNVSTEELERAEASLSSKTEDQ